MDILLSCFLDCGEWSRCSLLPDVYAGCRSYQQSEDVEESKKIIYSGSSYFLSLFPLHHYLLPQHHNSDSLLCFPRIPTTVVN
jgi:hypothetical protein